TEVPSVRMSNQMYSHVPGGDPCHDKLGFSFYSMVDRDYHYLRQNPKVISAMARQFNRRDSIVEAFHSMGWTATLQDMKWQIDRLTLAGISLHNFHAFYYTVNGITKHDAPPSQFLQNPYWEHYKNFADYCARSSRFITQTEASTEVAVLHPAVSWFTQLRNPFHRWGYTGSDAAEEKQGQQLIDDYKYICKTMLRSHIEYDDLDPEVMAMGRIENGAILVGRAKYKTLVVAPITCMEKFCFDLILKFLKSGGKVIFAGLTPFECIEDGFDPSTAFEEAGLGALESGGYFCKTGRPAVIKESENLALLSSPGGLAAADSGKVLAGLVKKFAPEKIEVLVDMTNDRAIISHRRENGNARYIMLACQDGNTADAKILFRDCPDKTAFYELDPETGNVNSAAAEKTKDGYLIDTPLSPWSSRIFAMAQPGETVSPLLTAVAAITAPRQDTLSLKLDLDKKIPVSIRGGNVYRLEEMQVKIAGQKTFKSKPNTFIEHLKESGSLSVDLVKFSDGFGIPQKLSIKYPVDLGYNFKFTVEDELFSSGLLTKKISLLRDRMGIIGEYVISLNGSPIKNSAWKPRRLYDQNNIAADVSGFLKPGINVLEVKVKAAQDWHGLSDPMYLLGNFGVFKKKGKFVIGSAPETAKAGAKAVEGFPFYSGKFYFEMQLYAENPGNYEKFSVELPEKYRIYECTELSINGHDLGVRCFSPYIWQGSAKLLKKGMNRAKFTITNTLGNMLEASYYDYEKQETVSIV
ncbi:MAG: hypothetical protein FWF22_10520, partial [Treponema sp.]|nr:hypothetical protein [Treponema sp.]